MGKTDKLILIYNILNVFKKKALTLFVFKMEASNLYLLFHAFLLVLLQPNLSKAENKPAVILTNSPFPNPFQFLINLIAKGPKNSQTSHLRSPSKKAKKDVEKQPKLFKEPKNVTNLYSTLKHFLNAKRLILIINFEGVDIHPFIEFPVILKQLEMTLRKPGLLRKKGLLQRQYEKPP